MRVLLQYALFKGTKFVKRSSVVQDFVNGLELAHAIALMAINNESDIASHEEIQRMIPTRIPKLAVPAMPGGYGPDTRIMLTNIQVISGA